MLGRPASFVDSALSTATEWEPECTSRRRHRGLDLKGLPPPPAPPAAITSLDGCGGRQEGKRRRLASQGTYAAALQDSSADLCRLTLLGGSCTAGAGDDARAALLAPASQDGTAGSLCCAETHDGLEEDCSSAEEALDGGEEGFAVYRSPRGSGRPAAPAPGGDARLPPLPPAVLLERLQAAAAGGALPPLAGDPDLEDMLSVLYGKEAELSPNAAYLEHHGPCVLPDAYLDAGMRRTTASWLVEVSAEFGLHQETLFLASALLDRFLSCARGVPRTQLQLVGVACTLVAAKHEEEMHPSIHDFTSIADNCFRPCDLLRMEALVLSCLGFRVSLPTAHTFLAMFKQALALQPRTCALASYLTELAMLEYELLSWRPSQVAAAAALLARLYTNDAYGISHMPAVTQCSTEELKPLLRALLALQHAAARATDYSCPYLAVRDKYRSHVWFCVSTTTPFDRLPLALLEAASAAGR